MKMGMAVDAEEINRIITEYFKKIFKTQRTTLDSFLLEAVEPLVINEMNQTFMIICVFVSCSYFFPISIYV